MADSEFDKVGKLLKEQINRRTPDSNLDPTIKALREGSYVSAIDDAVLDVLPGQWTRMEQLREELKVERNAIIALALEDVWIRFTRMWSQMEGEASHEIYRDDKFTPQFNDAADFQHLTYNFFLQALIGWRIEGTRRLMHPKEEWTPTDRAFDRLVRMMKLYNNGAPSDPAPFISRGVGTGTYTIWSLIQLVPELAKKLTQDTGVTLTKDEIVEVIRSGYGLVAAPFSKMHLEVGPELLKGFRKPDSLPGFGYDISHFRLERTKQGVYVLKDDKGILERVTDNQGNKVIEKTPGSVTTWCPAGFAKTETEGDVIEALFERCIELAKTRYLPFH